MMNSRAPVVTVAASMLSALVALMIIPANATAQVSSCKMSANGAYSVAKAWDLLTKAAKDLQDGKLEQAHDELYYADVNINQILIDAEPRPGRCWICNPDRLLEAAERVTELNKQYRVGREHTYGVRWDRVQYQESEASKPSLLPQASRAGGNAPVTVPGGNAAVTGPTGNAAVTGPGGNVQGGAGPGWNCDEYARRGVEQTKEYQRRGCTNSAHETQVCKSGIIRDPDLRFDEVTVWQLRSRTLEC